MKFKKFALLLLTFTIVLNGSMPETNTPEINQKSHLVSLETAAKVLQFDTLAYLAGGFSGCKGSLPDKLYIATTLSNIVINSILAKKQYSNDLSLYRTYRNQALSTSVRALSMAAQKYEFSHTHPTERSKIPFTIIAFCLIYDICGYLKMAKNSIFKKNHQAEELDNEALELDEESAETVEIG